MENQDKEQSYFEYHAQITRCEQLVADRDFEQAVLALENLFDRYDFVFLRDCKLAAELSSYAGNERATLEFVKRGVLSGWELKDLEKNSRLTSVISTENWEAIRKDYEALNDQYRSRLNDSLLEQVDQMFKSDQKKALGALVRMGQNAKEKYALRKFAPHSEEQMGQISWILEKVGYPGERLIGNDWKMSVILSHHNSISPDYNSKDSLYLKMRPRLIEAMACGELSPVEFSVIEDWREAVLSGHESTRYGFLGGIGDNTELARVNSNRAEIGMRSVELRNELLDLEAELEIDLYLPKDWQEGKIGSHLTGD